MISTRSFLPRAPSFREFASAIVHELRTPLTALSGEVELALRRDRTSEYYREALTRIAERTAELQDLTADLAFIGAQGEFDPGVGQSVCSLAATFDSLAARYARRPSARVSIEPEAARGWVEGDQSLLTGAIALLIEQALRSRRAGARIRVRVGDASHPSGAGERVDLALQAEPGGLWPVDAGTGRGLRPEHEIALAAAANALARCGGGTVAAATFDSGEGLLLRLRRAQPSGGRQP
jgi:signal transduction histidine kinase